MDRIHKSTKLMKGDIVKIFGGYSGIIQRVFAFGPGYHIVRVVVIVRQKSRMLISGDILSSNVAREHWFSNSQSQTFILYYRRQYPDKAFKLSEKEAQIELI